ncbi:hypothetical protein QYE76_029409 [Lolium multiflorum]|uniref:Reverse transcriptase Ty1/copia-type domain-containing protein n=1 Tax=Lolium multiflorum TaxID=4521 RepID=A0AAD8VHV2_LOLMU|nr:hypothetical protein QYE76_029409 [Lolium multiflorum]
MHLQMQMTGKKLSIMRWTRFFLMELGSYQNDPMDASVGCKWVFKKKLRPDGFVVNEADKCVYYRHGGGEGVILCLYVDDILIFGTNMKVIHEVKSLLSKCFDMKDLGEADVILNIKLIKNESGITLTQSHYVEKILSRFGYIDSKSSPTPYDPSVTLRKNRRIAVDQLRYSQIVGSLMYLASATRPDISFAVGKLSRFMSNPGTDHWHALDRVMRYLCGTMSYEIHYSWHPAVLEGYSDSNWISDVADLYATSGLLHPARRSASANGRAGLRNRSSLRSCTGEGELGFGKRSARLLKLFITGRLPSKSGGAAYHRLQRRLLRPIVPVVNNVVINNVTAATSSATPPPPPPPDRYV